MCARACVSVHGERGEWRRERRRRMRIISSVVRPLVLLLAGERRRGGGRRRTDVCECVSQAQEEFLVDEPVVFACKHSDEITEA